MEKNLTAKTWQIDTIDELKAFRDEVNSGNTFAGWTITLGKNIDLAGVAWTPIGDVSNSFQGTFDGNGKKIKNMTIVNPNGNYAGFFGFIDAGTVKDVTFENVTISGRNYVGTVAGYTNAEYGPCLISNVTVTGDVQISGGAAVGGIVGGGDAVLSDVEVNASADKSGILGTSGDVGGIIGRAENDGKTYGDDEWQYSNLTSNISVAGQGAAVNAVGGVIGSADEGITVNGIVCTAQKVAADGISEAGKDNVGGLVGVYGENVTLLGASVQGAVISGSYIKESDGSKAENSDVNDNIFSGECDKVITIGTADDLVIAENTLLLNVDLTAGELHVAEGTALEIVNGELKFSDMKINGTVSFSVLDTTITGADLTLGEKGSIVIDAAGFTEGYKKIIDLTDPDGSFRGNDGIVFENLYKNPENEDEYVRPFFSKDGDICISDADWAQVYLTTDAQDLADGTALYEKAYVGINVYANADEAVEFAEMAESGVFHIKGDFCANIWYAEAITENIQFVRIEDADSASLTVNGTEKAVFAGDVTVGQDVVLNFNRPAAFGNADDVAQLIVNGTLNIVSADLADVVVSGSGSICNGVLNILNSNVTLNGGIYDVQSITLGDKVVLDITSDITVNGIINDCANGTLSFYNGACFTALNEISVNRIYVGYNYSTKEDYADSVFTVADDVKVTVNTIVARSGNTVNVAGVLSADQFYFYGAEANVAENGVMTVGGQGVKLLKGANLTVKGTLDWAGASELTINAGTAVTFDGGDLLSTGSAAVVNNGVLNVKGGVTLQFADLAGAGVVNFTGVTLSADSTFNSNSAEMVYIFDGVNQIYTDMNIASSYVEGATLSGATFQVGSALDSAAVLELGNGVALNLGSYLGIGGEGADAAEHGLILNANASVNFAEVNNLLVVKQSGLLELSEAVVNASEIKNAGKIVMSDGAALTANKMNLYGEAGADSAVMSVVNSTVSVRDGISVGHGSNAERKGKLLLSNAFIEGGLNITASGAVSVDVNSQVIGNILNAGTVEIAQGACLRADTLVNSGAGKVLFDAAGFTGFAKILDLSTDVLSEGLVTLENGEGISFVYGADGDVIVTDGDLTVFTVDSAFSGEYGDKVGDKLYYGANAYSSIDTAVAALTPVVGTINAAAGKDAALHVSVYTENPNGLVINMGNNGLSFDANGGYQFAEGVTMENAVGAEIWGDGDIVIGKGVTVNADALWTNDSSCTIEGTVNVNGAYMHLGGLKVTGALNVSDKIVMTDMNTLGIEVAEGAELTVDAIYRWEDAAENTILINGTAAINKIENGSSIVVGAKGDLNVGAQGSVEVDTLTVDGTLDLAPGAVMSVGTLNGSGSVTIDAANFSGTCKVIDFANADSAAGFTGTICSPINKADNVTVITLEDGDIVLTDADFTKFAVNNNYAALEYGTAIDGLNNIYAGINAFGDMSQAMAAVTEDGTIITITGDTVLTGKTGVFAAEWNGADAGEVAVYDIAGKVVYWTAGPDAKLDVAARHVVLHGEGTLNIDESVVIDYRQASGSGQGESLFAIGSFWTGDTATAKATVNLAGKIIVGDIASSDDNGSVKVRHGELYVSQTGSIDADYSIRVRDGLLDVTGTGKDAEEAQLKSERLEISGDSVTGGKAEAIIRDSYVSITYSGGKIADSFDGKIDGYGYAKSFKFINSRVEAGNLVINDNVTTFSGEGTDFTFKNAANAGSITLNGSTFTATAKFTNTGIVDAAGTSFNFKEVVNSGSITLENSTLAATAKFDNTDGSVTVKGEATLNITGFTGNNIVVADGATIKNSNIDGKIDVLGKVTFSGSNTLKGIQDFEPDYLEDAAAVNASDVTVAKGASLTLTSGKLGFGYGDKFTIEGTLENAGAAYAAGTLTDADLSFDAQGGIFASGYRSDDVSTFTVNNAYVRIGSKDQSFRSAREKDGVGLANYNGTFNFNWNNAVVDVAGTLEIHDSGAYNGKFNFNLNNTVLTIGCVWEKRGVIHNSGQFMFSDKDSTFTAVDSQVISIGDESYQLNSGTLLFTDSTFTLAGALINDGAMTFTGSEAAFNGAAVINDGSITVTDGAIFSAKQVLSAQAVLTIPDLYEPRKEITVITYDSEGNEIGRNVVLLNGTATVPWLPCPEGGSYKCFYADGKELTNFTVGEITTYGENSSFVIGKGGFVNADTFALAAGAEFVINTTTDGKAEMTVKDFTFAGTLTVNAAEGFSGVEQVVDVKGNAAYDSANVKVNGATFAQGWDGDIYIHTLSFEYIQVNADWADLAFATEVADGYHIGINAFAGFNAAYAAKTDDTKALVIFSDVKDALTGNTYSGKFSAGEGLNVTVSDTIDSKDRVNMKNVTVDAGVTFEAKNIYFFGTNTIDGQITSSSTFYNSGSTIILNGSADVANVFNRYNANISVVGNAAAGKGAEAEAQLKSKGYMGLYSGTFSVKDSAVEFGYILMNQNNDSGYSAAKLVLDNAALRIPGLESRNYGRLEMNGNAIIEANQSLLDIRGTNNFGVLNMNSGSITLTDSTMLLGREGQSVTGNNINGTVSLTRSTLSAVGAINVGGSISGDKAVISATKIDNDGVLKLTDSRVDAQSLDNDGSVTVSGVSSLNFTSFSGNAIELLEGATLTDSVIGGESEVVLYGNATVKDSEVYAIGGMEGAAGNVVMNISGTEVEQIIGTGWTPENTLDGNLQINLSDTDCQVMTAGSRTYNGTVEFNITDHSSVQLLYIGLMANFTNSVTINVDSSSVGVISAGNAISISGEYSVALNNAAVGRFEFLNGIVADEISLAGTTTVTGALFDAKLISVAAAAAVELGGLDIDAGEEMFIGAGAKVTVTGASDIDGTITVDASAFTTGVFKVLDLFGTESLAGKVTVVNNADNVTAFYGPDGDVFLTDFSRSTLYVGDRYADKEFGSIVNGNAVGYNAFDYVADAVNSAVADSKVGAVVVEEGTNIELYNWAVDGGAITTGNADGLIIDLGNNGQSWHWGSIDMATGEAPAEDQVSSQITNSLADFTIGEKVTVIADALLGVGPGSITVDGAVKVNAAFMQGQNLVINGSVTVNDWLTLSSNGLNEELYVAEGGKLTAEKAEVASGYDFTVAGEATVSFITAAGALAVNGTGTLNLSAGDVNTLNNKGTVAVSGSADTVLDIETLNNAKEFTLAKGEVDAETVVNSGIIAVKGGEFEAGILMNNGNVAVNGGEFDAETIVNSGKLAIKGGEFNAGNIEMQYGTWELTGFTADVEDRWVEVSFIKEGDSLLDGITFKVLLEAGETSLSGAAFNGVFDDADLNSYLTAGNYVVTAADKKYAYAVKSDMTIAQGVAEVTGKARLDIAQLNNGQIEIRDGGKIVDSYVNGKVVVCGTTGTVSGTNTFKNLQVGYPGGYAVDSAVALSVTGDFTSTGNFIVGKFGTVNIGTATVGSRTTVKTASASWINGSVVNLTNADYVGTQALSMTGTVTLTNSTILNKWEGQINTGSVTLKKKSSLEYTTYFYVGGYYENQKAELNAFDSSVKSKNILTSDKAVMSFNKSSLTVTGTLSLKGTLSLANASTADISDLVISSTGLMNVTCDSSVKFATLTNAGTISFDMTKAEGCIIRVMDYAGTGAMDRDAYGNVNAGTIYNGFKVYDNDLYAVTEDFSEKDITLNTNWAGSADYAQVAPGAIYDVNAVGSLAQLADGVATGVASDVEKLTILNSAGDLGSFTFTRPTVVLNVVNSDVTADLIMTGAELTVAEGSTLDGSVTASASLKLMGTGSIAGSVNSEDSAYLLINGALDVNEINGFAVITAGSAFEAGSITLTVGSDIFDITNSITVADSIDFRTGYADKFIIGKGATVTAGAIEGTGNLTISTVYNGSAFITVTENGAFAVNSNLVISLGRFDNLAESNLFVSGITEFSGKVALNGVELALGEAFFYEGKRYELTIGDAGLALIEKAGNACVRGDINGDGYSDTVMVHAEGFSGVWLTQGDNTVVWGGLGEKAEVELLGVGQYNGGIGLFIKDTANHVGVWTLDNGAVTGYAGVESFNADTNVIGLGDFNGDGNTDLLLQSADGVLGAYLTGGTGWSELKGFGDNWQVAAVGDLNGDGIDDVVLQENTGNTGALIIDENGKIASWSDLSALGEGMNVIDSGDFNGDGVSDILISDGKWVGAWIVEDGKVVNLMGIANDFAGEIEQVGDFNGDGIDDIRLRVGTDSVGYLSVNGDGSATWNQLGKDGLGEEWNTKFSAIC